jgi:hypothetical protein
MAILRIEEIGYDRRDKMMLDLIADSTADLPAFAGIGSLAIVRADKDLYIKTETGWEPWEQSQAAAATE